LRFREPETIPIHPRFLPEAVNHTQPAKPTILWVRTLAHAGWALVDGEWCLLNTKGSWSKQAPKGAPQGKRAITPEFDPVPLDRLKTLVAELDRAILEVRKFGDALGRNS
jgi:hypothetical protein